MATRITMVPAARTAVRSTLDILRILLPEWKMPEKLGHELHVIELNLKIFLFYE